MPDQDPSQTTNQGIASYPRLKRLGVAWSLANLWYLDMWAVVEMLYDPGRHYFPLPPDTSSSTFHVALAVNIVALTALLYLVQHLADALGRKWESPRLRSSPVVVLCGVLLLRIVMDRQLMATLIGPGVARAVKSYFHIGSNTAVLTGTAVVVFCVVLTALRRRAGTLLAAAETALVLLIPVPFVALINASLADARPHVRHAATAVVPAGCEAPTRVVWIIFDELDSRFLFERGKQSGIDLPGFEKFRSTSLEAVSAVPPGSTTLKVIPSLLTGLEAEVEPLDADGPKVYIGDRLVPWWAAPNIFRTAKSHSISSAVIGWMHPYCDALRGLLAECFCYAVPDNAPGQPRLWEQYADKHGLFQTVLKQARYDSRVFETLVRPAHSRADDDLIQISREVHRKGYLAASAAALKAAANPGLDLILLHLPVPHPYGIYDRVTQQVSTAGLGGYVGNLLLADRTLAMIRGSMEAAGLWERSAVLVSSDHYLREELWGGTPFWDAEVRRVTSETEARFVPYLLKLPFQQQHSEFSPEFSTIVTRDLLEAVMARQLTSPEAVAQWLASRARVTSQSARFSRPSGHEVTRPGS